MFPCFRARFYGALAGILCFLGDRTTWSNALTIAGAGSLSAGAYWIYPPAGLIVAGLAAIAVAVLMHGEPREGIGD